MMTRGVSFCFACVCNFHLCAVLIYDRRELVLCAVTGNEAEGQSLGC